MDVLDGILGDMILEYATQCGVEVAFMLVAEVVQHQVERGGSGQVILSSPVLRVFPQKPQSNFEPTVTDEEEVVGSFIEPVKGAPGSNVLQENLAEHFWWHQENRKFAFSA